MNFLHVLIIVSLLFCGWCIDCRYKGYEYKKAEIIKRFVIAVIVVQIVVYMLRKNNSKSITSGGYTNQHVIGGYAPF